MMRVAVDPGLCLRTRPKDFQQGFGILEPADLAGINRIVVHHDDRRCLAIRIERVGEPLQLFLPKLARCLQGFLQ